MHLFRFVHWHIIRDIFVFFSIRGELFVCQIHIRIRQRFIGIFAIDPKEGEKKKNVTLAKCAKTLLAVVSRASLTYRNEFILFSILCLSNHEVMPERNMHGACWVIIIIHRVYLSLAWQRFRTLRFYVGLAQFSVRQFASIRTWTNRQSLQFLRVCVCVLCCVTKICDLFAQENTFAVTRPNGFLPFSLNPPQSRELVYEHRTRMMELICSR